MRVFVTGGTGFVGSHVVEELIERGHEPLCLVRETSDTEHLEEVGAETFLGSLTEIDGLRGAVEACQAVIHIAGLVKVREPRTFYQINGEATCRLAEMAAEANPELDRFVYVSSISAQGPGIYRDEYPGECNPVSHYGKSKLLGEKGVRGVAEEMPVSIFRPPPVYGPRDTDMFALFRGAKLGVAPVYGSGQSRMSVIHIFDLADAIVESVEREHPTGSIFPIDDGADYSWVELSEMAGKAFDKRPWTIPIPGVAFKTAAHVSEWWGKLTDQAMIFSRDKVAEMEQDSWVCGNRRLREELDWRPEWPLERGAEQTARWYVDNGWL